MSYQGIPNPFFFIAIGKEMEYELLVLKIRVKNYASTEN